VLSRPELVGELVELAAEPGARVVTVPGVVLLLEAPAPLVVPIVVVAPLVAPVEPADPPAEAPPPAPAANAMLLLPRRATVASMARQCRVCGMCWLLDFPV
jgi:hypothetical protein